MIVQLNRCFRSTWSCTVLLFVYSIVWSCSSSNYVLLIIGVVGLSIPIINQIAGSLLKDDKIIWKFVKDLCIVIMFIFMFCWFITGNTTPKISLILTRILSRYQHSLKIKTGCVWVFSMPLPNMTRFPDSVTPILPGLMNDLMMSHSTSLPTDEFASINSTMVSLFSPEKHCAFPVYGLAVWIVFSLLVSYVGYSIIVHMTVLLVFLLPEVDNVLNMELWQMNNVCWNILKVKRVERK